MLLAMDIGNTTMAAGIYENENLTAHWRLSSILHTSDELGIYLLNLLNIRGLHKNQITGVAFASVVPPLDFPFTEAIKTYFDITPLKVDAFTETGMPIKYKTPREVGADRIVAAYAGREKYGTPLIVADYGTAITLDAIDRNGAYLGGAIAPGLSSGISALFVKAAKLPKVALNIPESVIGGNTDESIQSGILFGNAGLTNHIVDLMRKEIGEDAKVVATGGHAELISKISSKIDYVDPWLMLEGLRLIYEKVNS